jgi:hypothetical protein
MKHIVFVICILCLSYAVQPFSRVEQQRQLRHYNVSTENFTTLCRTAIRTIRNNNIYLAINRKTANNAFYYGCDSTGRKKINISLDRNPDLSVLVSFNVLIEGDIPTAQSQVMAEALATSMNEALAPK